MFILIHEGCNFMHFAVCLGLDITKPKSIATTSASVQLMIFSLFQALFDVPVQM